MPTYSDVMSGGGKIAGCVTIVDGFADHGFVSPPLVLYARYRALVGVIEEVAVKELLFRNGPGVPPYSLTLYKDTLNGLWNENDLVDLTTAETLANVYTQRQQALAASITGCPA